MSYYSTGTISVTNGSASVTGTGTAWSGAVFAGDTLIGPDGLTYVIASVESDTALTLTRSYAGTTASDAAYEIVYTQARNVSATSATTELYSRVDTMLEGAGKGKFPNGDASQPGVRSGQYPGSGIYFGDQVLGLTDGVRDISLADLGKGARWFASRADFVADPRTWQVGAIVGAGGLFYEYDGTSTAISDLQGWKPVGDVTPQHWGFVADGSPGQTSAFQAAATYCNGPQQDHSVLHLPSGKYLLEDEIICWGSNPDARMRIRGAGPFITEINYNFYDPAKTLFQFRKPSGYAAAQHHDSYIDGLAVKPADTTRGVPHPCIIDFSQQGNGSITNMHFASCFNNAIRWSQCPNLIIRDCFAIHCGFSFPTVDASGVTFSGTSGTNTITANASICDPAHAGMVITLRGDVDISGKSDTLLLHITDSPTSTTYTVEEVLDTDFSTATAAFSSPLVSGASGTTTLTSNITTFNANQVGLFAYAQGVSGALIRFRIDAVVDGQTITIDCAKADGAPYQLASTLPEAISSSPIVVAAYDQNNYFHDGAPGALVGIDNDLIFEGVTSARHGGIGLAMMDNTKVRIGDIKLHGESDEWFDKYSQSALWADNCSFKMDGILDSTFKGGSRMVFGPDIRGSNVTVGPLESTLSRNDRLYNVATQNGTGLIHQGDLRWNGSSMEQLVQGQSGALKLFGTVSGPYMDQAVHAIGGAPIADTQGTLLFDTQGFTPEISDDESAGNVATAGNIYGRYTRINNRVYIDINLFNIDTTGLDSGNTLWIRGLPAASPAISSYRAIGTVQCQDVTFNGYLVSLIGPNSTAIRLTQNSSGSSVPDFLAVGDVVSGSADIQLSISYETPG